MYAAFILLLIVYKEPLLGVLTITPLLTRTVSDLSKVYGLPLSTDYSPEI